jgi:fatty acid desaturase
MKDYITPLRKQVSRTLGKEAIKSLHKVNRPLDIATPFALFSLFTLNMWVLATQPLGILWALCLILQGFLFQVFALANHDLFVHRRVLGPRWSYILGVLLTTPTQLSATRYHYGHHAHHRHLGGDGDSELFKIDIDSTWKRLLYMTFIGVKLAAAGKFAERPRKNNPPIIREDMTEARRRIIFERRVASLWFYLTLVLAVIWPEWWLLGYLLPLLLITPLANTLRTILEHSEFQPDRPFHINCYYRTGPISRPLFFWDSGDCHLVHHLLPGVPFYRIGLALRLMHPIFRDAGLVEHRNLWKLLWMWTTKPHPYRTPRQPLATNS